MSLEKPKSPWTWPLVALVSLIGCVVLGVVLALIFS